VQQGIAVAQRGRDFRDAAQTPNDAQARRYYERRRQLGALLLRSADVAQLVRACMHTPVS